MSVRKICKAKGCRFGDHRCAHAWWLDVMHCRVRYRMPVNEYALPRGATEPVRTKQEAEKRWAPLFMADIGAGRDPRLPPTPSCELTVATALEQYATSHLPELRGQQSAKSAIHVLQTHFGNQPLTTLEHPAPIEEFRRSLTDRKAATVNRYLARLRHFIGWAQARGWMNRTPFHRHGIVISAKREAQRSRRVYTTEEKTLLDACLALNTPEHWYAGGEMQPRIVAAVDIGGRRGGRLAVGQRDG